MLVTSIFSFSHSVFYLSPYNFNFSVSFILSSANAFNLGWSKILLFGKQLMHCFYLNMKHLDVYYFCKLTKYYISLQKTMRCISNDGLIFAKVLNTGKSRKSPIRVSTSTLNICSNLPKLLAAFPYTDLCNNDRL